MLEFLTSLFVLVDEFFPLFDFIQIFGLVLLDLFNYRFQMRCARRLDIATHPVFEIKILLFL